MIIIHFVFSEESIRNECLWPADRAGEILTAKYRAAALGIWFASFDIRVTDRSGV